MLKRTPTLGDLHGYDVIQHASVRLDQFANGAARPTVVNGSLTFNLASYETMPGGVAANERDSAVQIRVGVNDLTVATGGTISEGSVVFGDDQGDFLKGVPETGEPRHGAPVYEQNYDRWVVLRRNDVPLFVPVSRERYLRYSIRRTDAQLTKGRETLARLPAGDAILAGPLATLKQLVSDLEALSSALHRQLDAMTPAERAAAANVTQESAMTPPAFGGAGEGDAIVYLNPALIDTTLPRSTPQVLVITITGDEDHWPGLAARIDREIDWTALARVLH